MSPHPPNGGWSALRRTYPRTVAVLATLIAAFVVGDVLLAARWLRDRAETERLRDGMTDAERQRADMVADAGEQGERHAGTRAQAGRGRPRAAPVGLGR
ncbi:MAG: hypothetical protein IPK33_00360 [Gemmatimonadetes bacterium]|nr:hypothetical protein [Gemmatimonadota bacterium]